jgi:hypothetical protein
MSVPIAPLTVTAPVTLNVRFDAVPEAVPVMLERLTAPEPPVPSVSVTPSASVAAPKCDRPASGGKCGISCDGGGSQCESGVCGGDVSVECR